MSHEYREHLSALMDGELRRDESRFLLKRLERDADLGTVWARYHVARQVLRRQDVLALRPDFASGVFARIEAENVQPARRGATWVRWASGGAVAASVAVAALVLTPPVGDNSDIAPAAQPRMAARGGGAPVAAAPASVSTLPQEVRALPGPLVVPVQPASATIGDADWAQPAAALDPRLQSYLIRHYQAVGAAGQSAVVPYVLLSTPAQSAPAPADAPKR